jgi:purine nucleoside phosphorylase
MPLSLAVAFDFGDPSSPVRELQYGDGTVYLLARHGDGLLIPPHRINYRANLAALKSLGVDSIVAMNTVGVITAGQHPGEIAIPDQVIDYTYGRDHSFYDGEMHNLDHIEFTEPFAGRLRQEIHAAALSCGVAVHDGGVYAAMQGPRLETTAEVNRLERDGADYIGMTAMPEASLARELDMEYACLSLIVNYAAGRGQKAIHADIEASTMTARSQAMKILQGLFKGTST